MRFRMRRFRGCFLIGLWFVATALSASKPSAAAEPAAIPKPVRADGHALHALFEESHLAENVHEVRRRARDLPSEERFQTLFRWVMPGADHPGIRLAGDFTPCDPPILDADAQAAPANDAALTQPTMHGGELVSPALDLVDLAKMLGRLDELASCLSPPAAEASGATEEHQERARIVLLLLIHLAGDDHAAAKEAFGKLFDLFRQSEHVEVSQRWPETLALAQGVAHPATREIAGELLYVLYDLYGSDRRDWRSAGAHDWDHWFFSTFGKHKYLQAGHDSPERFTARPPLANWIPVSYTGVRTRGIGLPPPHWESTSGGLVKLSGHSKDYLYFRIPLLGEFAVECDLTPAAWRTTELLVGGVWVSPYWHRRGAAFGTLRDEHPLSELGQHITDADEWVSYRAVMRNGICTISVNGKQVYREPSHGQSAPWLAIRSEARSHSGVRDLRITGNPTIPEEIHLAADPELPGWTTYQDYRVGPKSAWRHSETFSELGGIVGHHNPALQGASQESLLRYHRPMLEDGVIQYEFFYEPDAIAVHPAIDRLAFLIEPQGVDLHWITDDKYDRTSLDPANRLTELGNRRGNSPLPLRPAQWNRLCLTLRGDLLELALNGTPIYERRLDTIKLRTFGLFHYADHTEARVRNIVWRGQWPNELPPLSEQELALPDHPSLAGLDMLAEQFSHDFAAGGAPAEWFEISGPIAQQAVLFQSDGLRIVPVVREAYTPTRVEYRPPIYGDFDAAIEFQNLEMTYGGRGVIGLEFNALDDTGMVIGSARQHREKGRISATAKMSIPLPDNTRRYTAHHSADESDAGTLRLVRRGATMHAFIAHGDSSHFRHLGSHRLPSAGTAIHLQPQVVSLAGAKVGVLLKKFSVRSNSTAIQERIDRRVASLDQFTLGLPVKVRHTFAASGAEGFRTSRKPHVVVSDEGLQVRTAGGGQAEPSFVAFRRRMVEDFDVSATFDELQLPPAANSAKAELVIAIAGDKLTTARLSVVQASRDRLKLTAEVRGTEGTRPDSARVIATAECESVDGLRIVRIQRTLFFLYSTSGFYQLLGMTDIPPDEVKPDGARFLVSGGADAPASVLLKGIDVRAAKLTD